MKYKKFISLLLFCLFVVVFSNMKVEAMQYEYYPADYSESSEYNQPEMQTITVRIQPLGYEIIPIVVKQDSLVELIIGGTTDAYGNPCFSDYLYVDPECTIKTDIFIGLLDNDAQKISFYAETDGVYYMKVWNSSRYRVNAIVMGARYFNGADRSVKTRTLYTWYQNDYNFINFKFTPNKTGQIIVLAHNEDETGSVDVVLRDSTKKILCKNVSRSEDESAVTFGVQKGKSYYFSMRGDIGQKVSLFYGLDSIREHSGNKQNKAKTIKRNKWIEGLQVASGKKDGTDWYKINLSKKQRVTFSLNGWATSSSKNPFSIKIIPKNRKIKIKNNTTYIPKDRTRNYKTKNSLPKGTYFIKVYKNHSSSNGIYNIKWK